MKNLAIAKYLTDELLTLDMAMMHGFSADFWVTWRENGTQFAERLSLRALWDAILEDAILITSLEQL